jgi:hypothetical protein
MLSLVRSLLSYLFHLDSDLTCPVLGDGLGGAQAAVAGGAEGVLGTLGFGEGGRLGLLGELGAQLGVRRKAVIDDLGDFGGKDG